MKKIILCSVALSCSQFVLAGDGTTELERKNLIVIAKQLNQLHELANEAEAASDKDARVKFNYQMLHKDISAMSQAIQNHINKPSRTPRAVPELNQSYSN